LSLDTFYFHHLSETVISGHQHERETREVFHAKGGLPERILCGRDQRQRLFE
jgi:hypothetical protein